MSIADWRLLFALYGELMEILQLMHEVLNHMYIGLIVLVLLAGAILVSVWIFGIRSEIRLDEILEHFKGKDED